MENLNSHEVFIHLFGNLGKVFRNFLINGLKWVINVENERSKKDKTLAELTRGLSFSHFSLPQGVL